MLAESTEKNILVLGVGRSGTSPIYSLLQRIMEDQLPGQTDYVYEPFQWDRRTFNKCYAEFTTEFRCASSISVEGIYHHKKMPMFCAAGATIAPESRSWLAGLFRSTDNRPHTLAKMIRANGRLGAIKKLVPNLKIVAIFRNPLEVINSSLSMFSYFGDDFYRSDYERFIAEVNALKNSAVGKIRRTDQQVQRESQYWQAMNQYLAEEIRLDGNSILPILQEQFVSDRETTVRRVCQHVGLEFQAAYIAESGRDVGPVQKYTNHLSVKQYLYLEEMLNDYREMAAELSSFDLDDSLKNIKERFITSRFEVATESRNENHNSLYARQQLAAKENTLTQLREQAATANVLQLALQEEQKAMQQKDQLLAVSQIKIEEAERELSHKDSVIRIKDEEIIRKEAIILEKEKELNSKSLEIQTDKNELAQQISLIKNRENELARRDAQILKREEALFGKDVTIRKQGQDLAELSALLQAKTDELAGQNSQIVRREGELRRKDQMIADLTAELQPLRKTNSQQHDLIRDLETKLARGNEKIQRTLAQLEEHESSLSDSFRELSEKEMSIADKQQELDDLQAQVNRLGNTVDFDAGQRRKTELELAEVSEQLHSKQLDFGQQQFDNSRLIEALRKDIHVQNGRIAQFNELLSDLRKVNSYPVAQFEKKLRAWRKLLNTYEQVKPQWHNKKHPGHSSKYLARLKKTVNERGVDLGSQQQAFFGNHRSGWAFAVSSLSSINNPTGIYLDCFIERSFSWTPEGVQPHSKPWIGFIHVPPFVPGWFQYEQANHTIFESEAWKQSLPHCRGLFTLSNYHRDYLQPKFNFPVESLIHPTEFPDQLWSWQAYENNREKRIVQMGWWLRKLHAIYQLPNSSFRKTMIRINDQQYLADLIEKERRMLLACGELSESMYDSVEVLRFLPNQEYDQLLSQNIVFLNLYDSSANNSVIECIARGTPLLINRLPAVVEYLGEDYPFYYDNLEQAVAKAMDNDLVLRTHQHLLDCPARKKLTGDYFRQSLVNSKLLLNVYQDFDQPLARAA